MRRLLLVTALVLVLAAVYRPLESPEQVGTGDTLTLAQPRPNPGEEAPNFEADRLNGGEFTLSDEGTYVLSFWNGLRQGSRDSRPDFARLARQYGGPEVSFAAVYIGGVAQADRKNAPYAVIEDSSGELTSEYNVKRVPRLFIVDDGVVRLTQNIFDEQEMRETLEATLRAEA